VGDQAQTIEPVSNGRAIWIGTLWVNKPVMAIMFGGWGLEFAFVSFVAPYVPQATISPYVLIPLLGILLVAPWVLAWTWWSYNVPKWRLWALERVSDWPSLESDAIGAGLIWNENSLFGRMCARTEIWSATDREREAELRRQKGLPQRRSL
jgi:hypothetical protein